MKLLIYSLTVAVLLVALGVQNSEQKSDCEKKRDDAERLVKQQSLGQRQNLAIVVPRCNEDGSFAQLQCHYGSQFCQCWDKEGIPMTQPKKNLQKCACMVDRAKALKSVPPSQTELPELTSCEIDGSYTAKQCSKTSCWCVNPETGKKLGSENRDKSSVKC